MSVVPIFVAMARTAADSLMPHVVEACVNHISGAIFRVGAILDALRRFAYGRYNVIMTRLLENLLSRMASWPKEAQAEAVRSMLEIEKKHAPVYKLSGEERAELDEALAECERGEIADDEDVADFFKTHGACAR